MNPQNDVERRPWPRHTGYLAGEDGSILGPSGRVLPGTIGRDGYREISVWTPSGARNVNVHVIVAEAWHGLRPVGTEAAHGNGDSSDNRPANLRWATPAENQADRRLHGTDIRGEQHGGARLTAADVAAIRAAYAAGTASQRALAARYGVRQGTISRIVQGRTWAHLPMADAVQPRERKRRPGERNGRARLTADDVRAIRATAGREPHTVVAARYGVSEGAIRDVLTGRKWGHVA